MRRDSSDFRFAIRSLRRSPGFVAVAGLSLALAIGLNTTMFAIVDAVLHPQSPVESADRLYRISFYQPPKVARAASQQSTDVADRANDLVRHARFYEAGSDYGFAQFGGGLLEAGGRSIEHAGAYVVPPTYFRFLGVRPYAGRFFGPGEDDAATRGYVVIGFNLWRQLSAPNQPFTPFPITLGDHPRTVIGVLPDGADRVMGGILAPWSADDHADARLVRVRTGVTMKSVLAELNTINTQLGHELGTNPSESRFEVFPVVPLNPVVNQSQIAMMAAVFAVLIIACSNISNLQLARGVSRGSELAVRSALGATRTDLLRLLLAESILIALAGGLAGVLASLWSIGAIHAVVPGTVMGIGYLNPQLSWRVFAFAVAVTGLAVVVFGLLPAVRVSRVNIDELLKSAAGTSVSKGNRRYYNVLIVAEIAGGLALSIGATLLFSAATKLHDLDFGYDTRNLVADRTRVWSNGTNVTGRLGAILQSVASKPEVVSAALSGSQQYDGGAVTVDDPARGQSEFLMPRQTYSVVTSEYLRTLGIPLLAGADFRHNDDGVTESAIVDSLAAARWWPLVNSVGRMIKVGNRDSKQPWVRVIGVSRHAKFSAAADESMEEPEIFLLRPMVPQAGPFGMQVTIVARVRRAPEQFIVTMRNALRGYDAMPQVALWDDVTGLRYLKASHDFIALVFVAFAAFGLGLAMIGVYGVVAHSVAQRTREFGVRFALGADGPTVLLMVLREGNAITLLGLAVGLILSHWATRLIGQFLFGIGGVQEMTILVVAPVAMFVAATLATFAPALRAARVDPVEALRNA